VDLRFSVCFLSSFKNLGHQRFILSDTLETYFDSHVDLLQRELKKRGDELRKRGDKLKMRADKTLENLKIRDLSGDLLTTSTENFEREFKSFKIKVPFLPYP